MNAVLQAWEARDDATPWVFSANGAFDGRALQARVAGWRERLLQRSAQRIATRLDNGIDWLCLDIAIRQIGAVHVPLPMFFSPAQVEHALQSASVDTLILPAPVAAPEGWARADGSAGSDAPRLHRRLAAFDQRAVLHPGTAVITYTSGTTAQPKGVCLDFNHLQQVAQVLADAAAPCAPRRHLCLMPLATLLENVGGLYAPMLSGAEICLPSLAEIGYSGAGGLDIAQLLRCLHHYQPHSMILLPQLLRALVMAAEGGASLPTSLRFIAVGGARVGAALIERAMALGLPVFEGYGMSECASVVCLNRPGSMRPGSGGRALPHVALRLGEGDVLEVQGPHMLGYLGQPAAAAGHWRTGDLGRIDDDGFVHVLGRADNVIVTAYGRNVAPEWVESELLQHAVIAQVAMFGEAQAFNSAVIVPRSADTPASALRAVVQRCNADLPEYARIAAFVVADVPFQLANGQLTANGRPRRALIAQHYADALLALQPQSELLGAKLTSHSNLHLQGQPT
ncbi:MAG TPA: AMP-binding protein [Aquimonas sp.]|jgi:long-chain acyl-CoA synthetase|nr:AMP-binding protein [Aquimonas sp.]